MPIRIPDALPATDQLLSENIFVMTEYRAMHQDIRPLRVVLLNLMPTKIATETQILRKLSNTPLQIEITLLRMASHDAKNVSEQHLETFYRTFDLLESQHFDGMIITGAPVELLEFEEVDYWPELSEIMEWSRTHVHSTLHICWGAQAGIYYHYGICKHELPAKVSGVFEHRQIKPTSPLLRGFDDLFWAPHSRYTEVRAEDIERHPHLELLAVSDEAGVYIAKSTNSRHFFVFGHPEYDRATLNSEYERDVARGLDIAIPAHYYPDDNPANAPKANWRAHAQLLYTNWLNYYVYQTTPYEVERAGTDEEETLAEDAAHRENAAKAAAKRAQGKATATRPAKSTPADHLKRKPAIADEFARAANEDDDGYDPYSDRREVSPLFEPDPWK
ncbi:MAG: homoserine O-succinyltransferase [Eggerthellaceae bacterium]|nr:homoserine O-succinyltransferase [Eggerthellaceae bacterium]